MDSYGRISVQLTGVTTPVIVQLFQEGKEIKILDEKYATSDGSIQFDYLNEGNYHVRAIIDRNGNKKWDTGNYLKHVQPEEIKYLPVEINLKQNFDIEQEFDLSKTYIRENPEKKEKK